MRALLLGLGLVISHALTAPPPASAQASLGIIPDNGAHPDSIPRVAQSSNDTVKFYVKNTSATVDVHFGMTCNRTGNVTAITKCGPGGNPGLAPGDSLLAVVVFSVGAVGTGRVTLTATSTLPPGATATGGWDISIVPATQVLPKNGLATALPSTMGNRVVFTVKNNSSASVNYTFGRICTLAASSCTSAPSRTIAGQASDTISVTYSTSAVVGDTGRVKLIASVTGIAVDTGSFRVVLTNGMAAPVINAANYNPGRVLPRDQCLIIALSAESAAECGDLRSIYQLPMFRVLNVERRPTLLYNSATAQPVPEVAVKVTVPALTLVPDTIEAVLSIGAMVRGRQRWAGEPWDVGAVPRYIRVRDTVNPAPATSLINYTVQINSIRSGVTTQTASVVQPVIVVNRQSTSPFGNGWWIAGLEKLSVLATDTLLWVGGDGSARIYARPFGASGAWGTPSTTYPDSVRSTAAGYVRQLPDSVWVYFGASGRHDSTRNRQRHVTKFAYDGSARLQTITLPIVNAGSVRQYTFSYGSSYYIVTEGWRPQTTIWQTAGRVDSIIGPLAPNDAVRYAYAAGTNLLTQRTDRRGGLRRFELDAQGKVKGARFGPVAGSTDPQDSIIVSLTPAEARGISTTGSVDSVQLHASYDGPRLPPPAQGGVVDTTVFWVNRFGAPHRIVNALGDSTRLDRANASFPGLVTRLKTATGQIVLATYDTRGRILTVMDSTFALATTTYQWDPKWDQLTRLVPPENDSLFFLLNPSNGDRIAQWDVRVDTIVPGPPPTTRRDTVVFAYDPTTRQVNLITGPGTSFQGFTYDALGDVAIIGTQSGYQRKFIQDNIGRTARRETQIDVAAIKWRQEFISYDLGDRDTLTVTKVGTDTTTQIAVRKYFDREDNLDSLTRRYKIPSGTEVLTTRWNTDLAGRRTREIAPDGQNETYLYDTGSNDTSMTTRRGDRLSLRYDALNRLTMRVIPPYVYPFRSSSIPIPSTPPPITEYNYKTPGSTDTLAYAADGQLVRASNRFANVTRQYNASGLLLSETLSIQKADTTGYGTHVYLSKYEYDRNRRRVSLIVPRLFKATTDTMRFSYYPWGGAYQTQDVSNLLSANLYNARSELMEIIIPGSIFRDLTYTNDGEYARDRIINGLPGGFPRVPNPDLRDQRDITYDARSKMLTSSDVTQFQNQTTAQYSDLGYLIKDAQLQKGIDQVTGAALTYSASDSMAYDGLGNLTTTTTSASGSWGYTQITSYSFTYQSGTGRLSSVNFPTTTKSLAYDAAGQAVFESTGNQMGAIVDERASFFGADGRLVAVEHRVPGNRLLEEYRYDALGRRIWVRGRYACAPVTLECTLSRVRRTVWDGGQELAEIQVPDTIGAVENDSSRIIVTTTDLGGSYLDPNPFFGRVLYTPGWQIDQPLGVTRFGYNEKPTSTTAVDTTWTTFTIFPHWNIQGVPTQGTFGNGAFFRPKGTVGGQMACPAPHTNATDARCVFVTWPGGYSAYDLRRAVPLVLSWHGSLLENKRDASGLDYKRNRFYDPVTRRFSQEDPIGLAGGLNLYAFSGSDPVTFDDPFGLLIEFQGKDALRLRSAFQQAKRVLRNRAEQGDEAAQETLEGLVDIETNRNYVITVSSVFGSSETDPINGSWVHLNSALSGSALTATLAHELGHAYAKPGHARNAFYLANSPTVAVTWENAARRGFYFPGHAVCQRSALNHMQIPFVPPCGQYGAPFPRP